MKKAILGLATFLTLSTASAANYLGGSLSIKGDLGGLNLHYQTDTSISTKMRYGLDIDALSFGTTGSSFGGTAAYLADFAVPAGNINAFRPYYGAGLGAGLELGNTGGLYLYPHGLLGTRFDIATPLSVFGEVNAGPAIAFAGGANVAFGWGARIGVNYRLN